MKQVKSKLESYINLQIMVVAFRPHQCNIYTIMTWLTETCWRYQGLLYEGDDVRLELILYVAAELSVTDFVNSCFFPTDWQHQTMFDSSGLLTLHYGKHHTTLIDEIRAWFDGECFADVALVCEGKETLRAHRLVLASSSPLIKKVLQETPSAESPVIIQFPGVRAADMRLLLDFLYTGQAYVKVHTRF